MNRREFLAALGGSGTAAVAGCSGSDGQTGKGQEGGSGEGENGTPVNGGSNETDLGNGQQNGGENGTPVNGGSNETDLGNGQQNGGENGSENGGQNGQPEELLEAAKILDGQNQNLESLTLGDGENATTGAEIYINAEADTQTTYNAEITYSGEEPNIAEEIEQILDLEGEIEPGEQATLIGEISYEQIKQQVDEEINAEIEFTVEAGETGETETVNLPLTLKEKGIDFEELRQRHRQNRQNFLRFVPQKQGEYIINFKDYEVMKKIAEEHDVETDPKSDIFYDFLHEQDESLDGLNYSDTKSWGLFTMQDPENPSELIGVSTFVFGPEIDSFESFRDGDYTNTHILSHKDYPHQVSWINGSDFPEVFIDILEDEHPDLNQELKGSHSNYSFKETEAYRDGIVFNFGNGPRQNSLFDQSAVEPFDDINAFRYHEDGTVTDEHWKWNEESREYELELQLERRNIGETLDPLTSDADTKN